MKLLVHLTEKNFLSIRVSLSSEGNANMNDIYSFHVASNKLTYFFFFTDR